MELKLIGIYADKSQRRYIITAFTIVEQQYNNLILEEMDSESNFVTHSKGRKLHDKVTTEPKSFNFCERYNVTQFPTLVLLKEGVPVSYLVGKHDTVDVLKWLKKLPWLAG